MSEHERRNTVVIEALMAELEALEVREFCVCAGARNVALLDALTKQSAHLTLYSFFDERAAAFFALGRVLATRRPVGVVTTSGTAVAELFPAVMEAHYQALPLVLITADRPSRYRGSGAPQAVEQPGLFAQYLAREVNLECAEDARCDLSDVVSGNPGAIHFNVCLEEGLSEWSAEQRGVGQPTPQQSALSRFGADQWRQFWALDTRPLVLASGMHPDDAATARGFLLALGAPIVAEATSNLLGDEALEPLMCCGGEKTLRQLEVSSVLRLGAVPSWRWWRDLEARDDVPVLNVCRAPFRGLARQENVFTVPWEALTHQAFPFPRCLVQNRSIAGVTETLDNLLHQYPNAETAWMRHLSRAIGAGATVFLGNSLPIREWNLAAGHPPPGVRFFANRGANGIDGLTSTWLGLSADAAESWLILGDLSALYDLSAPWILPQLQRAKRRVVVINNGGGQIFSRISWLRHASAETQRVMANPHTLSFEPWARLWGMDYKLMSDAASLRDDNAECAVWEVRPDAAQTEAFWQAWQG
ncbi:MAG: 2-succinyl-5-enolpyruvyl-6-hydroxy-3-cyclohexene-1-carboxylic-acid synthase [Roseimicrobium sp.]